MTERDNNHGRRRRQRLDEGARHELDMVDRVLAGVQTETADDADLASFALRVRGARPEPGEDVRARLDATFAERMSADREIAAARASKRGPWALPDAIRSKRGKLVGAGAMATVLLGLVIAGSAINQPEVAMEQHGTSGQAPTSSTAIDEAPQAVSPEMDDRFLSKRVQVPSRAGGESTAQTPLLDAESGGTLGGVRRVEQSVQLTLAAPSAKVEGTADDVIAVTDRFGGFVVSSSVTGGDEANAAARFEVKLPAKQFRDALAAYSGLAHVRERTQQTQDVTDPYRRATSRVSDARAEVERLRAQLVKASDAQASVVRVRLRAARRSLEAREQSLSRMRNRVNYVTMAITIVADETAETVERGVIRRALDTAVDVLQGIVAVLIVGLAIVVPFAAVAAAVVYLRRRVRRSRSDILISDAAAGGPGADGGHAA